MNLSTGRDTDIVRIVKCEPKIFLSSPIYANVLLLRKYCHIRVSNNDSFSQNVQVYGFFEIFNRSKVEQVDTVFLFLQKSI